MGVSSFEAEAQIVAERKLAELSKLTVAEASNLPGAHLQDIVIDGKEVQLTIFKQLGVPDLSDAVLVTVQIARAGLGSKITFHFERALVYSANGEIREATQSELLATGGS